MRGTVAATLGLVFCWEDLTLQGNTLGWIRVGLNPVYLPLISYWFIWMTRNYTIFRGIKPLVQNAVLVSLGLLAYYPVVPHVRRSIRIGGGPGFKQLHDSLIGL